MTTQTAMIPRQTITQMVDAYRTACDEIQRGYGLLQTAQDRLKAAFADRYGFETLNRDDWGDPVDRPAVVVARIKRSAWGAIAEMTQLRRVLSIAKAADLDKQITTGLGLPEIDEAAILGMLNSLYDNLPNYLDEAVTEVFEWLRPRGDRYKTNSQFEIGRRVILSGCVERWCGGTWHVSHYREQNLRALDNVFHMLDGQPPIASYRGPLGDAIDAAPSDGIGRTVYFKFRCCQNNNLHLEFLRPDLVEKLNTIAGGNRLRAGQPTTKAA